MRVGYVRVSTVDQNTVRQLDGVDVERTFTDTASGKDTARPRLEELLAFVRDGDVVLVHSMDRLARNLDDLRRIVRTLTGKGVRVEFVQEHLVFSGEDSPMATLLLSVMGAFAEFERALILERQREGIAAAKARGAYTGRKPALTPAQADQLRSWAAAGGSKAALARELGISRETVYAYLRANSGAPAADTPKPPTQTPPQAPAQAPKAPAVAVDVEDPVPAAVPAASPTRQPADAQPADAQPADAQPAETGPAGRVVDLAAELGDGWQLVAAGEDTWRVQRHDVGVGTVRRDATGRGRRGWRARLASGLDLPAHGTLAVAGGPLWRTRGLAAAAIAHHRQAAGGR